MLIDCTTRCAHVHGQVHRPAQIDYKTKMHSSRISTDHCSAHLGSGFALGLGGSGGKGWCMGLSTNGCPHFAEILLSTRYCGFCAL